jgi:broad specificity phosphatase PhoE
MTTTILLIRHGQTDWNVARRWQGHEDRPLNPVGVAQAQALARRLAGWPIQAVYSSDLRRAAVTAETLGQALGLQPIYDPAWRERHVGDFQGLTDEEVRARFAHILAREDGIMNPPNGEQYRAVRARVAAAFNALLERHENEMAAVISHGGTLNALISHALGFPTDRYAPISLRGNTGLSVIEVGPWGPRLTLLNDTSHLTRVEGSG